MQQQKLNHNQVAPAHCCHQGCPTLYARQQSKQRPWSDCGLQPMCDMVFAWGPPQHQRPYFANLSLNLFDTNCCENASDTGMIAILDGLEYS